MQVILFSKDRPMQLYAYLDSMVALTDIGEYQVTVITPSAKEYEPIKKKFDRVFFVEEDEGGMDKAVRKVVNWASESENILWGVDDAIWLRPCSLRVPNRVLNENPDIIGFNLRVGRNIEPFYGKRATNGMIMKWAWASAASHYGYPWDLTGSIYRSSLVKEIIESCKTDLKTPNFLESYGVNYIFEKKQDIPYYAAFDTYNYVAAMDINRVQSEYENKFDGGDEESAESLLEKFKEGYRIDWTAAFNSVDTDCFIGRKYLKLKKV